MEEQVRPGHVCKTRLKSKGAAGVRHTVPPLLAVPSARGSQAGQEIEPMQWTYDEIMEAR